MVQPRARTKPKRTIFGLYNAPHNGRAHAVIIVRVMHKRSEVFGLAIKAVHTAANGGYP